MNALSSSAELYTLLLNKIRSNYNGPLPYSRVYLSSFLAETNTIKTIKMLELYFIDARLLIIIAEGAEVERVLSRDL